LRDVAAKPHATLMDICLGSVMTPASSDLLLVGLTTVGTTTLSTVDSTTTLATRAWALPCTSFPSLQRGGAQTRPSAATLASHLQPTGRSVSVDPDIAAQYHSPQ
jgi:hypothetical protein